MTTVRIDGFDKYGQSGQALPVLSTLLGEGNWSVSGFGTFNIVTGLSASGGALAIKGQANQNVFVSQGLGTNLARIIGGVRVKSDLLSISGVAFFDNSTAQLTICIEKTSGFLTIRQGYGGTVLAFVPIALAANTIHYLEWDITFNTNAILGGWTIWLDGVQVLAGTGVTSQSGFNYANVIQFVSFPINFFDQPATLTIDDMYIFNDSGSFNNSALLSNPAVVTDVPHSDALKQFANNGNIFGNYAVRYPPGSGDYAILANTIYLIPFTPNVSCTINDIVVWVNSTSPAALFKGCIYADSAGAPAALLSDGLQVTGCTVQTQLALPLVTPQNLTGGQQYWLGLIGNTNIAFPWYDGASLNGYTAANTYGSGSPNPAPAMTPNQKTLAISGFCTGATTNWESEALNPPMGDASSVGSGTPADEDLYGFPALLTNAVIVYVVALSANARLSFPGTHTFSLVAFSGGTPGSGSNININPTINYTWYDSFFETDPNTSTPWTTAAVTAADYGMGITS